MSAPKPIALTYVEADEYAGPAPQPFVVVGAGVLADLIARVEALEAALD
ncbi:hypothetical protein [Agromyces larvae]|uniref:Uncharacterized protein n=1 Tax=Agromyces larvae TaxID=2929802 RepID=A0ABY4CBB3_9MICO|nr:hypothetical protein [Agromyces larvae]UOE45985.1 hypothetical protein MTO99_09650 [Agromyces larvae]